MKIALPKNLIIYLLLTLGCASIAIAAQFILFPTQYNPIQRATEKELTPGLTVEIWTPATIVEGRVAQVSFTVRSQSERGVLVADASGDFDVSLGQMSFILKYNVNFKQSFYITAFDVGDKTLQFNLSLRPSPDDPHVRSLRTLSIPITVVPTLKRRITFSVGLFVAVMSFSWMALAHVIGAREHELRIEQKVEQAENKAQAEPEKAKYAWDVARINLESYFGRNRVQVAQVFGIAVIVMSIGFIFVCVGVYLAMHRPDTIKPALVAGISGIITQFIGATFMVIYRSTMTQANEFMVILERINTVGMAIQVLDSIPDSETTLKNESRAKIVELLLSANIPTAKGKTSRTKSETV